MTTPEEVKLMLEEENPEALLFDGHESALVGVSRRCGQPVLAVYDEELIIQSLIAQGLDAEEAVEFYEFNVAGAWVGPMTPIILVRPS
jgi:hypothetical protein